MTGAQQHRPHREAGNLPRIPMRPSRFVLAALVVFIAIAGAAVFECIAGHFGAFDGTVAALVVAALLGVGASRWRRRQPAAIALHADGLTVWDRADGAQYFSIIGCAQWSGRLLALTLSSGKNRPRTLIVAADAVDSDTFRQLAVRARRAASAYL
ncbi:protein YgfX [Caballeronia grimmiae]|uniref:protein YgfX n=1 Tax=Caballeronia grimmiae TaxID=1071679 RepID=UPI0038B9FB0E